VAEAELCADARQHALQQLLRRGVLHILLRSGGRLLQPVDLRTHVPQGGEDVPRAHVLGVLRLHALVEGGEALLDRRPDGSVGRGPPLRTRLAQPGAHEAGRVTVAEDARALGEALHALGALVNCWPVRLAQRGEESGGMQPAKSQGQGRNLVCRVLKQDEIETRGVHPMQRLSSHSHDYGPTDVGTCQGRPRGAQTVPAKNRCKQGR
jgi:hypothetical protein